MKLVWSPEKASKAYIDTVKSVSIYTISTNSLFVFFFPSY